jgi:multicomponent Na+:H+ antiporter subunit D
MSYLPILPCIIPLTAAAASIFLSRHWRAQAAWSLGALLTAFGISVFLLAQVIQGGQPIIFQMGGWVAPFGISMVADLLSATMAVMVQSVMLCGLIYAIGAKDAAVRYPSFMPLFLALTTGLTGGMLTGDIFNLFVMVELIVISAAALTAMSDDRFGAEAAYKYVYISAIATMTLLIGIGALYVSYGTLNMADLAQRIAANPDRPMVWVGIIFLFITFMNKSAIFPMHFWQPDFHTVAPTPISAMLSSVVVKLGVYMFMRMTTLLFVPQAATIQLLLLICGVSGVVFGGLAALGTHNAKRMLAYSTLAQIGFILIGIGWGTPLSLAAAIVFTINHSLIKSAMLMLAGYVASRAPIKTAAFNVIQGVGRSAPVAGVLFFVGAMALAGVPPTNGFISKFALFQSGAQSQQWLWLALIGVPSLFTLVYAMRAFMRIWWQDLTHPGQRATILRAVGKHSEDVEWAAKPYGDSLLAPAILIGLCVGLGLFAEPILQLALNTANWMLQPAKYVSIVLGK